MATKSIGAMLLAINGLRGTKDLTTWQDGFVRNCMETSKNGTLTAHLSGKQVEIIEEIYGEHFA